MTISVVAPFLNERYYAPGWLANVQRYADQIITVDTGSTDGTGEFLRRHGVTVLGPVRVEQPYIWPEGKIRQMLLDAAKGDWIVKHDFDELWGKAFFKALPDLKQTVRPFVAFPRIAFWIDERFVRVNQGRDNHWQRHIAKMWQNIPEIRYIDEGNHARETWYNIPVNRFISRTVEVPIYHYHYLRPLKKGDNRWAEENRSGLRCETYFGSHPVERALYGSI